MGIYREFERLVNYGLKKNLFEKLIFQGCDFDFKSITASD